MFWLIHGVNASKYLSVNKTQRYQKEILWQSSKTISDILLLWVPGQQIKQFGGNVKKKVMHQKEENRTDEKILVLKQWLDR